MYEIKDIINKVIMGDCLEVMKGIPDKSVDMILADLPYGTTACKWDTIIPFEPLWEQYKRIIKDNGAIVLTASQPFTSALVMSNLDMFKYPIYWIKDKPSNFFMGKKQPLRYVEECLVFAKGTLNYNPQMQLREEKDKRKNKITSSLLKNENIGINEKTDKYQDRLKSGMNDFIYPRNYQKFNNRTDGLHPTQKPVALFEYLIKTYTNEGDIVLDNVAGSGTTGVACKNTNRNYILIEKEPEYIDIINKRLTSPITFNN
jgi:site-specific DNA-methyltransferase (adenine-specific)